MAKRSFRLSLQDRANQMEKALSDARARGVPEKYLRNVQDPLDVMLESDRWFHSDEYWDKRNAKARTEEHNNLLRFIQWYLSWDGADPKEFDPLERIREIVVCGGTLNKAKWLIRMRDKLVESGDYDPEINLKRSNAPWR